MQLPGPPTLMVTARAFLQEGCVPLRVRRADVVVGCRPHVLVFGSVYIIGLETVLCLHDRKNSLRARATLGDNAKDTRALVSGTPGVLVVIFLIKNAKLSQNQPKNIHTNAICLGSLCKAFGPGGGPAPRPSAEPLGLTVCRSTVCKGKLQGCRLQACKGSRLQGCTAERGHTAWVHAARMQAAGVPVQALGCRGEGCKQQVVMVQFARLHKAETLLAARLQSASKPHVEPCVHGRLA